MTRLLCALVLLLMSCGVSKADSITVDGRRYDYLLFTPAHPSAIVIAFHGAAGSGQVAANQMKLHLRNAPDIVVYPSGWWTTWDSRPNSIDVHFAAALIKRLKKQYGDLPVCVTGISAGGSMAWRVAMEVAAVDRIVSVAGPLNPATGSPTRPPPSALELHGAADAVVPLQGNASIPAARLGINLIRRLGGEAELRVIPNGTHTWDFGVGYPTTDEVVEACN